MNAVSLVKMMGGENPAKCTRLPSAKPAFLGVAWQAAIHDNQQCSSRQCHGVN